MVKPDVKHNYYADLELPTTASVDDIRKAYRKLALQYHPDRNAGKEAEVVPRFQAIQAANEVLCDPTTKAQYD
ncbi:heat shock protein DnaJ, partial [Dissoconium aciculare CBS 342.82]|uniref:Heat shock protein DnaJ n=1 Tax=Dissoconium aciculare CBS 342.82 TaxID=1314786 RepID=A0A6J3MCM8_9PEZI